jgi:F-type H+-transporting ATPase subunit gamma
MQTLEALTKRIKTAQDLLSVVKTMKSLAAVNIRQYERAVESLEGYRTVVDMGWQVFVRFGGPVPWRMKSNVAVVMVIGTDQGMCGQFNEIISSRALEELGGLKNEGLEVAVWTVGEKVRGSLLDAGYASKEQFGVPGSLTAIKTLVQSAILTTEAWRPSPAFEGFYICHNVLAKGGGYEQTFYKLLPLDKDWAEPYASEKWPGRCLPLMGLRQEEMFSHLFKQYLFVSFYRAMAQSLASENAARLVAMQSAEKNILDMEEGLVKLFREQRQAAITNELLDIVSGFEALGEETYAV